MSHDQDKKCLDDSMMVDTSSAATRGRRGFAVWRGRRNNWQSPLLACPLSFAPS
jgi:hypothetical protein